MIHPTRDTILRILKRDPQATLGTLRAATGLHAASNIQYHIHRLVAAGLIEPRRNKKPSRRQRANWEQGNVPLRKMTKAEEEARIEAVVAKAQARGTGPSEDVIRISGQTLFHMGMKASRLG